MSAYELATLVSALAVLVISAITDMKTRKVPNVVTFPAMILGIVLTATMNGSDMLFRIVWLVFLFFFGTLGLMGMGDLKLLMALVALRGMGETSLTLLFGSLLLIAYCLVTETTAMTETLKDTGRFLTIGTGIRKLSDSEYPFAPFFAIAYPIAWFVAGNLRW